MTRGELQAYLQALREVLDPLNELAGSYDRPAWDEDYKLAWFPNCTPPHFERLLRLLRNAAHLVDLIQEEGP